MLIEPLFERLLARRTEEGRYRQRLATLWCSTRSGLNDLDAAQLAEISTALFTLGHARTLLSAVRRYVFELPRRYRAFRRARVRESKWFNPDSELKNEVNEIELDALLLASLRTARELLTRSEVRSNVQARFWQALEPVLTLYRNQVLVDEVTDFAVLQLACMANLMHPNVDSFFASGDFNQRLTVSGSASLDDVRWAIPSVSFRTLSVLFRQSRRLQTLSQELLKVFEPEQPALGVPSDIEGIEVAPVLLEGHSDIGGLAEWLANRAREIERSIGLMPSLAIFVTAEADVEPLAGRTKYRIP